MRKPKGKRSQEIQILGGHTQIKSENDSQDKMRMFGQNNEKKQQKKKLKTESN